MKKHANKNLTAIAMVIAVICVTILVILAPRISRHAATGLAAQTTQTQGR